MPVFLLAVLLLLSNKKCADNARETPVVKIVRDNSSAVVSISTEKTVLLQENPLWVVYGNDIDSFFRQFYGAYPPVPALKLKSVGSGVILDKEHYSNQCPCCKYDYKYFCYIERRHAGKR